MTYDLTLQSSEWVVHRVGQGILIEGGAVLLAGNRWYTGKPLMWTLPGGRAEEGEGIAEALVREFREETGLEVEVGELVYVAESRSIVRRQLFLVCAFTVKRIGSILSASEAGVGKDAGVEEVRFVPFSELAGYMPAPSIGEPLRWYIEHPQDGARYWFFPEYMSG